MQRGRGRSFERLPNVASGYPGLTNTSTVLLWLVRAIKIRGLSRFLLEIPSDLVKHEMIDQNDLRSLSMRAE